MSGRPPPTGPRALRAPILPGAVPGQSSALSPTIPSAHPSTHAAHSPQLPAALPSGPPRFSAIPTGPRSLVSSLNRPPPTGPKHSTPPTPTLVPPSSRHAPSSAAEKRPAGASRTMDSGGWQSSQSQPNGVHDTLQTGARPAISIPVKHRPAEPRSPPPPIPAEPASSPPPPPPSMEPSPPPPPPPRSPTLLPEKKEPISISLIPKPRPPPSDPPPTPQQPPPPQENTPPPPPPLPLPPSLPLRTSIFDEPPKPPPSASPPTPPPPPETRQPTPAIPEPEVEPAEPEPTEPTPPPPTPPPPPPPPARDPTPEPPKLYSLPPLPDWPPPQSSYPSDFRTYKLLYDGNTDSATSLTAQSNPSSSQLAKVAYYKTLMDHAKKADRERIQKAQGHGKDGFKRFAGKVWEEATSDGVKEEEVGEVKDPRKEPGWAPKPPIRGLRKDFIEVRYEYDKDSTGPPPPTSVLITNIPPLTPNANIRRHYQQFGPLASFEPQIDKENGSALGVVFVKYQTHDEAKKCVEKENGRKGGIPGVMVGGGGSGGQGEDGETPIRVVLDGEGLKLKAVLKELEERKRRDREEKERKKKEMLLGIPPLSMLTPVNGAVSTPPQHPSTSTSSSQSRKLGAMRSDGRLLHHPLPPNPNLAHGAPGSSSSSSSTTTTTTTLHTPNDGTNLLLSSQSPITTASASTPTSTSISISKLPIPPIHGLPQRPSITVTESALAAAAAETLNSGSVGGGASSTVNGSLPSAASVSGLFKVRTETRASPMALPKERVGGGESSGSTPLHDGYYDRDRDRERDRDRDRERDRDRDRERDRERGRERERGRQRGYSYFSRRGDHYQPSPYNALSSRSPSPYSSYSSSYRDRDRDRDRSRDRYVSSYRDRDGGREYSRDGYRSYVGGGDRCGYGGSGVMSSSGGGGGRSGSGDGSGSGRLRKSAYETEQEREEERNEVLRKLFENGFDYVKIVREGGGGGGLSSVRDEEVVVFFEGFYPDKVLRDHTGLYVTFPKPDSARRAQKVLSIQNKTLSYQPVTLTVQPAVKTIPASARAKGELKPEDIVEQVRVRIVRELRGILEKDVVERIVSGDVTRLVGEMKQQRRESAGFGVGTGAAGGAAGTKGKGWSLKGLSFKKQKKEVAVVELRQREEEVAKPKIEKSVEEDEEDEEEVVEDDEEDEEEEEEEEEEVVERPKKKRRKEMGPAIVVKRTRRVIDDDEIESEEEDLADLIKLAEVTGEVHKKRATEEAVDEEERQHPVKKKLKVEKGGEKVKKGAGVKRRSRKVVVVEEEVQVPVTPSESRSPSPVPKKRKPRVVTPPPTPPPPDPLESGLCEDDEDLFYAKLALSGFKAKSLEDDEEEEEEGKAGGVVLGDGGEVVESATFRKHVTGSARTEGYYKITHAEKAAYVAQYQARAAAASTATATLSDEPQQPQHITSSRSNRANARRRAQGLEEINQFQRAVALSMGETAATANELTFIKFNQLQTRKKHLRFAKSPIHDWGLYAMERIARGEMVIEYVGEVIRAAVADKREKAYERQGIGSSYLFRIDEDLVVDATKKGNLGRLINHSCDPNCTAKIITISGVKKIVIYAKQDIELGDEITYDYHFPFEQDKIPCLCGSAKCRGFLN